MPPSSKASRLRPRQVHLGADGRHQRVMPNGTHSVTASYFRPARLPPSKWMVSCMYRCGAVYVEAVGCIDLWKGNRTARIREGFVGDCLHVVGCTQ